MNARILVALITLFPALTLAHPGHGRTEADSWVHYLTEPVHAVSLAIAIVAIVAVWWGHRVRSERTRR